MLGISPSIAIHCEMKNYYAKKKSHYVKNLKNYSSKKFYDCSIQKRYANYWKSS